jgi:hypothetical protein
MRFLIIHSRNLERHKKRCLVLCKKRCLGSRMEVMEVCGSRMEVMEVCGSRMEVMEVCDTILEQQRAPGKMDELVKREVMEVAV